MNYVAEWIAGLPWWGAFVALALCLFVAAELGFRLGRGARKKSPVRSGAGQVGAVLGGLLGLLGLLLGFSFGIVESRYSARKALVVQEANAIGTSYLRAALLPEERGAKVRSLLREYVGLRLRPTTPAALQDAIASSGRIHATLWREAELVGRAEPSSKVVGLFIESLNEVIDLHTSRVSVVLHQRLPAAIFRMLLTVSVLALLVLGYASGLVPLREPVTMAALVVCVASVVVMIRELDMPGASLFRVDQWAMEDVRRSMTEN
jgi:hypothetical protein